MGYYFDLVTFVTQINLITQTKSQVAYEKNYSNENRNNDSVFSKRIKAGKRRTYFFDVKTTRSNDYFITITESKKRFDDNGYDRHKMFLYKEDFNKFLAALTDTIDFVKTDLMPDFDFNAFNHDNEMDEDGNYIPYNKDAVVSNTEESNAPQTSDNNSEVETPQENETSSITNEGLSVDEWKM